MKKLFLLSMCCFLFFAGCQNKSETDAPVNAASGENGPAAKTKVKVETSLGEFIIELYSDRAPKTVEQFLKNVNNARYNNSIIHDVVKDHQILIGGVSLDQGNPETFEMANEARADNPNLKWTVAMLHAPDKTESDSMQFFINMKDNPELNVIDDGATSQTCGYCVFGIVAAGFNTLEQINQVPVVTTEKFEYAPQEDIVITKISVE